MKSEVLRFIIPVILIVLIDLYSFQAVRTISSDWQETTKKIIFISFWSITALALGTIIFGQFVHYVTWPGFFKVYLVAFILIVYLSKVFILPFLFIDDLIRLVQWVAAKFSAKPGVAGDLEAASKRGITRSEFISQMALIVAGVPLVAFIYGMIYGGYDLKVHRIKLRFKNLPQAFNKLRIVQISDIHSGSFMNDDFFKRAVKEVAKLEPDVIFFTGDLVNSITSEVRPFIKTLNKFNAPMGVYSILGNHDYGDYADWDSPEAKATNLQELKDIQKQMGWKLLLNEHVHFEKDGQKIALAGVENWSASTRFTKYGDLSKAMKGIGTDTFTILLSHDPSHWKAELLKSGHVPDLTLSGHTHGMQFGIETKLFRWSPSQYFYDNWAGAYKKEEKHLYVNRGLGFIGYPGRAGIRPEITLIELNKS